MREMRVVCDFCEKEIEDGKEYFIPTSGDVECLDVCPRCMAILEDEVRRRLE